MITTAITVKKIAGGPLGESKVGTNVTVFAGKVKILLKQARGWAEKLPWYSIASRGDGK